jgi:hypothetical protein
MPHTSFNAQFTKGNTTAEKEKKKKKKNAWVKKKRAANPWRKTNAPYESQRPGYKETPLQKENAR